ncbi:MAG: cytochrome c-type biogenesis protein CcmH [Gemmatimonadota bacterium]
MKQQQQPAPVAAPPQEEQLPGGGVNGSLREPEAAGRSLERTGDRENDPVVVGVEHRLRCTCGCGLDVYTCRTTDFVCTVSPRMHREVLALQDQGKGPQQIVDAFVATYGEVVLMAPKPVGFNLAGYLVPGSLLLLAAGALTFYLRRREMVAAAERPKTTGPSARADGATQDELDRLDRALREDD